jgi:hypothetical protein
MSSYSTISRLTSNRRYARQLNRLERFYDFSRRTVPTSARSIKPSKLKAFLRAARPRHFDHVCELMAVDLGLFMPRRVRELRQALRLPRHYMKVENALIVGLCHLLRDRATARRKLFQVQKS